MKSTTALTFRIATEDWLFEAIHRLNYKTFVDGRNFEIRVAIPGESITPPITERSARAGIPHSLSFMQAETAVPQSLSHGFAD